MRYVSTIFSIRNKAIGLAILLGCGSVTAQENSPYSRYGLGNIVPGQNVLNRGMGGVSAAYADGQSVNFINPASYSNFLITTFDVGIDIENRTLRRGNSPDKFTAANMLVNYVQIGMPLKRNKWGLNFGLKPVTRINYNIAEHKRLDGIDSIQTLYQGSGGAYQAFAGTGYKVGNFSIGVNGGYFFGRKEINTRISFINDSVYYARSNSSTNTSFGSAFVNGGIQYAAKLSNSTWLRFGAYGNLEQNLKGSQYLLRETFTYNADGATTPIDSIYQEEDKKGSIVYPANFGVGLILDKPGKWMLGVDFEQASWSKYKYFDETDAVDDSWMLRVGLQILPSTESTSYWSRVNYRAGFYTGPDYISLGNSKLNQLGFTLGAGLPVRRQIYSDQFTVINTSFEFGRRGNNNNLVKESYFRLSVGLSLSDIWFKRREYY